MHRPGRRLDAGDVGRRVVVRHRLPDGRATDVLGDLLSLDADQVVVRDRHGAEHHIAVAAIVAAKPVPPPPPRRPPGGRPPRQ